MPDVLCYRILSIVNKTNIKAVTKFENSQKAKKSSKMKYVVIICGILAIKAVVQANAQQADEENQGVNSPGRAHSRPYGDPNRRPQIYRNQQPSQNENVNSQEPQGKLRPHYPYFEPKPQLQPEQEESENNESDIPQFQPVVLDGNDFSILNNAGNRNSLDNSSANRRRYTTTTAAP